MTRVTEPRNHSHRSKLRNMYNGKKNSCIAKMVQHQPQPTCNNNLKPENHGNMHFFMQHCQDGNALPEKPMKGGKRATVLRPQSKIRICNNKRNTIAHVAVRKLKQCVIGGAEVCFDHMNRPTLMVPLRGIDAG